MNNNSCWQLFLFSVAPTNNNINTSRKFSKTKSEESGYDSDGTRKSESSPRGSVKSDSLDNSENNSETDSSASGKCSNRESASICQDQNDFDSNYNTIRLELQRILLKFNPLLWGEGHIKSTLLSFVLTPFLMVYLTLKAWTFLRIRVNPTENIDTTTWQCTSATGPRD